MSSKLLALAFLAFGASIVDADGTTYNAPGVMVLQVSDPIEVSIVQLGSTSPVGTALLPNASEATVTGTTAVIPDVGDRNTLVIDYAKTIPVGEDGGGDSFSSLKITIETTLYTNISYWKVTGMTVDYAANIGGQSYQGQGEDIYVDKVPGFTHDLVDLNCARGYSSCAPLDLSWTCDGQTFQSKKLDAKDSADAYGASLFLPGLEMQHFSGNATTSFGFNWDCDPIFTSALWVSLLIGLLLILFLFWACDMVGGLYTPDRFDDAKKPQIMVPTSE